MKKLTLAWMGLIVAVCAVYFIQVGVTMANQERENELTHAQTSEMQYGNGNIRMYISEEENYERIARAQAERFYTDHEYRHMLEDLEKRGVIEILEGGNYSGVISKPYGEEMKILEGGNYSGVISKSDGGSNSGN